MLTLFNQKNNKIKKNHYKFQSMREMFFFKKVKINSNMYKNKLI